MRQLCVVLLVLGQVMTSFCHTEVPEFTPSDKIEFQDTEFRNSLRYYRHLHIHGDHLYVGSMEFLYKLQTGNVSKYMRSGRMAAMAHAESICKQSKTDDPDCHNHVRTIVIKAENIYVCGTGAKAPRDYYLRINDLTLQRGGAAESGLGKCPGRLVDNSTSVFVTNGNPDRIPALYSGTTLALGQAEPIIYRPELERGGQALYNQLRTSERDSTWLHDAQFVGSFDVGSHVFMFFRETSIEHINCGSQITSRVARLCKNDQGGTGSRGEMWTSYLKATLNCSIPANSPFYFSHITDVWRDGNSYFAMFNTDNTGLCGSAICEFTDEDIKIALGGKFKEQPSSNSYWVAVPDQNVPEPRPGSCNENSKKLSLDNQNFISQHPLMDSSVASKQGQPLFHTQDVLMTRMAMVKVRDYIVFYMASTKGVVYKVVYWSSGNGSPSHRRLAVWYPFGKDRQTDIQIWSMKVYNDKWLYLSTDEKVVQLSVEQCSDYTLCTDCVRDPHCGWNKRKKSCEKYNSGLIQSVTGDYKKVCEFSCDSGEKTTSIRVPGDAAFLECHSVCSIEQPVSWRFTPQGTSDVRTLDLTGFTKYILTKHDGLVILNITDVDEGVYRCADSDGYVLQTHQVKTPDCRSQDSDCTWKQEFRQWCSEFDQYRANYNHWLCLKNKCTTEGKCGDQTAECPAPDIP